MTELETIARAVHEFDSSVPWDTANPQRRAYAYRMARTIASARKVGQTVTEAADRLIVWYQVDYKQEGPKGRKFAEPWLAQRMDDIVMAAVKGLAAA